MLIQKVMQFFYSLEKKKGWWVLNFEELLRYGGGVWLLDQERIWATSVWKTQLPKTCCFAIPANHAISFFALCPTFLAVSTAGANPNPLWLASFIDNGYEIYCGFDADEAGDRLAQKMLALYPTIKRLRPSKHDWNDVLIAKSKK